MLKAWRRHRDRNRRQRQERVLGALALAERRGEPEMAGWPLMQATGLHGPALYAALAELETCGEVVSRWVEGPYPRRRLYRLADQEGADRAAT